MNEPDAPEIDRRLREAFEDEGAAAARVARTALSEEGARSGRRAAGWPRRWAAVAAGAAVLLVAFGVMWWPARQPSSPEAGLTPVQDAPLVLSGSIVDGALVVSLPDGSTSIAWGGVRNDRLPDGSGIVLVEGVIR